MTDPGARTTETGEQHEPPASAQLTGALYRRAPGGMFEPLPITSGPWRLDAQHGGPPSALLAHLCEQVVEDRETIARLRIDLLAGIPLEPLAAEVERRSISRRVTHVEARLRFGSRTVAQARALVLAVGEVPAPQWRHEAPSHSGPSTVQRIRAPHWAADPDVRVFHRDGLEHRMVSGAFGAAGPATDWVRLRYPVVEGVAVTGIQRIMASVDVGSGISAVFDPSDGFGMINADLDVTFVSPPNGDWLLLDAVTHLGPNGTGMAITRVFDEHDLLAIATQCLLGTTFNPG